MAINRRQFLVGLAGSSAGLPFILPSPPSNASSIIPLADNSNAVFKHGVASGDPLHDRVILWTRVTVSTPENVMVEWEVAEDYGMRNVVQAGKIKTGADKDFTVKVDVSGLLADFTYYFRFRYHNEVSTIGKTRTLPVGNVAQIKLAVVSCANYSNGYFNVYRLVGERNDVDAVVHLGDYIYETLSTSNEDPDYSVREHSPAAECRRLEDYRSRHAQYKTDDDLQFIHSRHPFICIWDDHEFANNAWCDGAPNYTNDNDAWLVRKDSAMRAYFEWMPIREPDQTKQIGIYRKFQFGDLVDLIMLDTRIAARPAPNEQLPSSENDSLLGTAQESWLLNSLDKSITSGTRWRFIGQQVMLGQLTPLGYTLNIDQWDGFPGSRARLLQHLRRNKVDNVVFLTGDVHTSWASDIALDPYDSDSYSDVTGNGSIAVELITPAVTSNGLTRAVDAFVAEQVVTSTNPHVKYVDLYHRGFLLVDIRHDRTRAEWYHVETVTSRDSTHFLAHSETIYDGRNRIG